MYFLGPHVSIGGGIHLAPKNAASVGATGFGLFLKNQRQWEAPPLTAKEAGLFKAAMKEGGYPVESLLPHAGYLINLASPSAEARQRSIGAMADELRRAALLGIPGVNVHPGSSLRQISHDAACDLCAESINALHGLVPKINVILENTAGQGGCIGDTFASLGRIRRGVNQKKRLRFCIDTAHAFSAGMDIRTAAGFFTMMDDFDNTLGLSLLAGMHLNDSMVKLASRVDRHASLGEGSIGWAPFKALFKDPRFENIPLVLETPDESRWAMEIKTLLKRELYA